MAIAQNGLMTANPYFSQGSTQGFGNPSGSLGYMASGGVDDTPAAWMSGFGGIVRSTAWIWYNDGPTIEPKVKLKVDDGDDVLNGTGTVQLELKVRKLQADSTTTSTDYSHLDPPSPFPNVTDASQIGSYFIVEQNLFISPTESWTTYGTSGTYSAIDTWHGAAVRIKIKNNLKNEFNQSVTLRLDNARVQCTNDCDI